MKLTNIIIVSLFSTASLRAPNQPRYCKLGPSACVPECQLPWEEYKQHSCAGSSKDDVHRFCDTYVSLPYEKLID
ncbi:hypothetical protein K504DRAFT_260190 [Pleomassaria siparia CBS 279.74]|uniref:Extracellular membrane protein CFEM domain-containing protein n=1 Tax=Pleomassaria siparia CBS 279.74 TaxID=1314801 RepID=A0A6G1KDD0_9PLEO|nr:hypothetical protein K504DRAFT_260190 [Pleomassaria siparia CBS 279.74]